MPYAKRNFFGQIESLHQSPAPGAEEAVDPASPEVRAFLGLAAGAGVGAGAGAGKQAQPAQAPPADFDQMDADFVRVLEDIIDLLIVKNVITITELPAEAQAKLMARRHFRDRVSSHALRLFSTDFGGFGDR